MPKNNQKVQSEEVKQKQDGNSKEEISSIWSSLDPADQIPPNFWILDFNDLICFFSMIAVTVFVWASVSYTSGFHYILDYWDGPNYLYAGATLYKITEDNPWTRNFKYDPSYFACHLPGYPLLIKLCSLLFLNNYIYGFYCSIIVSGLLLCYTFRRLLIITNSVLNPTYTTVLLSIIPTRLVIYHSVGASEPLFLTFVSLSLILYKTDNYFLMLLSVWGGCVTRIEGMAIGGTIGLCYLLRFRIVKAFGMFLTFLAPFGLTCFHQYRFNDALAYLHFNQGSQGLIKWPPFDELLSNDHSPDQYYSHSFISSYCIATIGTFLVYTKSVPIGIFSTSFLIYVSFLFHLDIYRYAIPVSVFAYLIGFDEFWSSRNGKLTLIILLPFYLVFLAKYTSGQISSNAAWPQFMQEVFWHINKNR